MKRIFAICLLVQFIESSISAGIGRNAENSGITYVQIKPQVPRSNQQVHRPSDFPRTSRIENVPLQIKPAAAHPHSTNKPLKLPIQEVVRTPRSSEKSEAREDVTEIAEDYADRNKESEERFDTSEAITPSQADTDSYQTTKISVPQTENDLFKQGEFFAKQGASPPFNGLAKYGKPKYSKKYYGTEILEPAYRKYLETRHYRSRCRCAKITNCPKLQISVPRCPEEYFMCCF